MPEINEEVICAKLRLRLSKCTFDNLFTYKIPPKDCLFLKEQIERFCKKKDPTPEFFYFASA